MDASKLLKILAIGHDVSMRGEGLSLRDALLRADYVWLSKDLRPADLFPLVVANPTLVRQWIAYSEDKRTAGGWYLNEDREIGMIDAPRTQAHFDSMEIAVSEYVLRELDFWASVRRKD
jgi:hypothetical protein